MARSAAADRAFLNKVKENVRMLFIHKSKEKRNLRSLALTLVCALLLTFALSACDKQDASGELTDDPLVTVLRLTEDVERGEKITSAKYAEVQVGKNEAAAGAISDQTLVKGKYALTDLEAGDYLIAAYLSDEKPQADKVEVELEKNDFGFRTQGVVVVTDYLTPNGGNDLIEEIRKIISKPTSINKVIYFPDGEYIISKPIITSSAGTRSISLKLAPNAIIKASDDWNKLNGAMIQLGKNDTTNNIDIIGSNYYIEGGIIDGNGRADGISIEYGRETSIRNLTVINTATGVHFNNLGNVVDSDAENITIIGNGAPGSIGLHVEGSDSTFTNFRISNVQIGVRSDSPAHIFRNIRVKYVSNFRLDPVYEASCGFLSRDHRCWFDTCVSEGFSTAFSLAHHGDTVTSCVASWDEVYGSGRQIALTATHGQFNCVVRALTAEFTAPKEKCDYLVVQREGRGYIYDPIFDENAVNSDVYKQYLRSGSTK